jgi:pyruvate/2-oxoglutarate dehydrogenase complex dihydrolipoamide acyltransferase (E2) component
MAERTFAMPDLGEGLEEGEIVEWLVSVGDTVALNQPIVEVETAKATVEIPSPFAGVVMSVHGDVGQAVPVGDVLVTFEVASDGSAIPSPTSPERAHAEHGGSAVAATPAVRKLAKTLGVDLTVVAPTGPGGRATAEDVQAAAGVTSPAAREGGAEYDVERISIARRTIAERLTATVREVPHVTTFRTLDATALGDVRRELGVSPLPVFVKAVAEMCRIHPVLHSSWHGELGEIHVPRACHVGIAADTERGLTVPVVHGVWELTVAEVDAEIRRLAAAARAGSLTPDELTGGTISVSNTGSYGSEAGTPIINPGQGAVIALGVIASHALVIGDEVVARPACTLSLSFDHRLMDGATAGRALTDLVELLQDADRLRSLA